MTVVCFKTTINFLLNMKDRSMPNEFKYEVYGLIDMAKFLAGKPEGDIINETNKLMSEMMPDSPQISVAVEFRVGIITVDEELDDTAFAILEKTVIESGRNLPSGKPDFITGDLMVRPYVPSEGDTYEH